MAQQQLTRQAGDVWESAYWGQTYTVAWTDGMWTTALWADGSTSTHCTPLDPRDRLVARVGA